MIANKPEQALRGRVASRDCRFLTETERRAKGFVEVFLSLVSDIVTDQDLQDVVAEFTFLGVRAPPTSSKIAARSFEFSQGEYSSSRFKLDRIAHLK